MITDKYAHALACYAITMTVAMQLSALTNAAYAVTAGFLLACVIGLAKELRDETFSTDDLAADLAGAFTGFIVSLLILLIKC